MKYESITNYTTKCSCSPEAKSHRFTSSYYQKGVLFCFLSTDGLQSDCMEVTHQVRIENASFWFQL